MRTVFVNPSASMNPRRRKRNKRRPVARARKVTRRRRRRNAGIAPFVSNPMIAPNPRRRHRKTRRNPTYKLGKMLGTVAIDLGGGLVGAGANIIALRRVDNTWIRNGLRIVLASISSALLQNNFSSSVSGSLMYPAWAELALASNLVKVEATEADLDKLSADLEDILDEIVDDDDNDEDEDEDEDLF